MKIINDGLPPDIYNLICESGKEYDSGNSDYTVTQLLNPPRIAILKKRHWNKIEEAASSRIWSVFGSAIHYMIERHSTDASLTEQRYFMHINNRNVSGQIDCYNDGVLSDYKVTSAWSIVHGSKTEDWTMQLNMCALLMEEAGYTVHTLQITALLKDWDKHKAKIDRSYPQCAMVVIPIMRMKNDQIKTWMQQRVCQFDVNDLLMDDLLEPCSSEEMWESPSKYAVMKEGRKSAVRLFDDPQNAETFLKEKGKDHYVQIRLGDRRRCSEYCPVNKFCSQFKEYEEQRKGIDANNSSEEI